MPLGSALTTSELQTIRLYISRAPRTNEEEPRRASWFQPLIAKAELRLWSLLAHKDNKRPVRQLKEVGKLLKLLAHTHLLLVYLLSHSLSLFFNFKNVLIKAPGARRKSLFLPAGWERLDPFQNPSSGDLISHSKLEAQRNSFQSLFSPSQWLRTWPAPRSGVICSATNCL